MPPMYLNLVAIAALIAIASVMHKVPQIGTNVSVNIWISANLEYKVDIKRQSKWSLVDCTANFTFFPVNQSYSPI